MQGLKSFELFPDTSENAIYHSEDKHYSLQTERKRRAAAE